MANGNRMEELIQSIEANAAFRAELEQAPSVDAKRAVLDRHGFSDVTLADVQAYARQTMPELSDEALNQIAGGADAADAMLAFGLASTSVIIAVGSAAVAG